jgi:hypothetical protein
VGVGGDGGFCLSYLSWYFQPDWAEPHWPKLHWAGGYCSPFMVLMYIYVYFNLFIAVTQTTGDSNYFTFISLGEKNHSIQFGYRWVNNYPQCRYIFCNCLRCWVGPDTVHVDWLSCLCDAVLTLIVHFCHECHVVDRMPCFSFAQKKNSDLFLWAEGVQGAEIHKSMSVQCGDSVVSQQCLLMDWGVQTWSHMH